MLYSRRLKKTFKKIRLVLSLFSSVLLIFGCFFIFFADNFLSFWFSITLPILLVLNIFIGVYWLVKKNKLFFLSLACLILYFLLFDSFIQFNSDSSLESNTLSILTYNTNGFKHEDDTIDNSIVSFINSENPDVFCIQEFSAIKYKNFKDDYPYWYKTNIFTKNKSVMAIFSKYPFKDKGYVNFPNSGNGAMYVDVIFNKKNLRVYNIHLESYRMDAVHQLNNPNSYSPLFKRIGKAEKIRKEQALLIKSHIDKYRGKVIICGDFNSTQFSSSYNLIKDSKKDSFIEAGCGMGKTYELFKYPFRLDYILVDEDIEVLSHQNFDLKLSDHEPMLTKLVVN